MVAPEKVVIALMDGVGGADLDFVSTLAKESGLQLIPATKHPDSGFLQIPKESSAILVKNATVSSDFLHSHPNLKLIYKLGILLDNIDMKAAADAGIEVRKVLLPSATSVAEHTFCLMLAVARRLLQAHQAVKEGRWLSPMTPQETSEFSYAYNWAAIPPAIQLSGKTLGLIGLGEIGAQVAARANAFSMKVIYYKRRPISHEQAKKLRISYRSLEELLAEADIVSLHLPHTPATHHLLNRDRIASMKLSAILINTSRGGIIDSVALADALSLGKLAGAGLDVFEYEPLPRESPLIKLDNVVLTPHIAGAGPVAFRSTLRYVMEDIAKTLRG